MAETIGVIAEMEAIQVEKEPLPSRVPGGGGGVA